MGARLVSMRGIGQSFGSQRVLDEVSMDLDEGEVHILAGENGAGKSTLMKILGGVYSGYDGEIEVRGRAVRFSGPQEANRSGISVIHQEMSLVETMNVTDNIFLGREHAVWGRTVLDRCAQTERALELCRELDLDFSADDLTQPVGGFMLSTRHRIEIAKALAYEARILVMDEPTSALNSVEVDRLFTLIRKLKAKGCGIIYISHKMEEIYRLADRITVLRDGRWVGTAAAQDCPGPRLIQWMIGREFARPARDAGAPKEDGCGTAALEVRDFFVPNAAPGLPPAVSDLSLRVQPGEIVGIAGLQGSGGTEFFHGLFGSAGVRCQGSAWIEGQRYRPKAPAYAVLRGMGYVTADRRASGLIPEMSVERNVTLAALRFLSPAGLLSSRLEKEAATEQSTLLGIRASSLGQEVRTLSGGNQQKVVLAKWILTNPKILLLDDPTRGVDIGAKAEIYAYMARLTARGTAILLISSELPELLLLSDRIIVLHRGSLTGEFPRAAATPERILAAAMGAGGVRGGQTP